MSSYIWEVVKQDGYARIFTQLISFIFLPVMVLTRRSYAEAGWEHFNEEGAIRLPTFYGASNRKIGNLISVAGAYIVSVALGIIHLYAWLVGSLPSVMENFLWVVFTGVLFFIPICALLCVLLHRAGVTLKYVSVPLLLGLYIFVRIFLLVLAFAALRDLPPKALEKMQWPPFMLIFMGN